MVDVDSVPLTGEEPKAAPAARKGAKAFAAISSLKGVFWIFILFMFVVSDFFTSNILAGFGDSAVRGRSPTAFGTVLQGVFLVLGYIAIIYLAQNGVL